MLFTNVIIPPLSTVYVVESRGLIADLLTLCPDRFLKDTCTEDDLCKLAHGEQELKEWMERREFLLMKLAKARKDHLIAPNDDDFGKYSFLLKDII